MLEIQWNPKNVVVHKGKKLFDKKSMKHASIRSKSNGFSSLWSKLNSR